VEPVARGGQSTIEGLSLRCAEHNRLEAERVLGRSFMEHKVAVAQAARRETTARFVTVEAAESSPRDTAFDDVVRALRSLGMGDREARRAAACAGTIGDPLEERIRCALRASAPRSFRGTGPPPSRTAPPSGGHAVIAAPSG
jgi:hypothetical protein